MPSFSLPGLLTCALCTVFTTLPRSPGGAQKAEVLQGKDQLRPHRLSRLVPSISWASAAFLAWRAAALAYPSRLASLSPYLPSAHSRLASQSFLLLLLPCFECQPQIHLLFCSFTAWSNFPQSTLNMLLSWRLLNSAVVPLLRI